MKAATFVLALVFCSQGIGGCDFLRGLFKSDPLPPPAPKYPQAILAEYLFKDHKRKLRDIKVAVKITLKEGEPRVMYVRRLSGKRGKLQKVNLGRTANRTNFVGKNKKGQQYGFYWDKEKSKIAHSFSFVPKPGQLFFGSHQKKLTAAKWKSLLASPKKKKKKKK